MLRFLINMTNPASLQKRNGKYLWFALLGLGFQPDSEISSIGKTSVNVKHINLGPYVCFSTVLWRSGYGVNTDFGFSVLIHRNMFDKPNKDAFYIVTHFLLDKLSPTRFSESYR